MAMHPQKRIWTSLNFFSFFGGRKGTEMCHSDFKIELIATAPAMNDRKHKLEIITNQHTTKVIQFLENQLKEFSIF